MNYYQVLGVSNSASYDEIRAAYKKLVFELHPDRNPSKAAEERFILVQQAHEVLTNPALRERHDQIINGEVFTQAQRSPDPQYEYKRREAYRHFTKQHEQPKWVDLAFRVSSFSISFVAFLISTIVIIEIFLPREEVQTSVESSLGYSNKSEFVIKLSNERKMTVPGSAYGHIDYDDKVVLYEGALTGSIDYLSMPDKFRIKPKYTFFRIEIYFIFGLFCSFAFFYNMFKLRNGRYMALTLGINLVFNCGALAYWLEGNLS